MNRKNPPNKGKNIDDVLSSIDSLLDTATEVDPLDEAEIVLEPPTKTESDQIAKAKPDPKLSSTADKSGTQKTKSANQDTKKPGLKAKKPKPEPEATPELSKTETAVKQNSTQISRSLTKSDDQKFDEMIDQKEKPAAPTQTDESPVIDQKASASPQLSFNPVTDDFTQAMQKLPVLNEMVTAEELSLIGSGKEPPKKTITELHKRKSTTDKIIELLKNHLADYEISNLEFSYLHELIEETLDAESKKER